MNRHGEQRLIAVLMYGTGMRLLECLRLRVKDIDFGSGEIIIREGKGDKDRHTVLPEKLRTALEQHLARVKQIHERDLAAGYACRYRTRSTASTPMPQRNGAGHMCFRRRSAGLIGKPENRAVTMLMSR